MIWEPEFGDDNPFEQMMARFDAAAQLAVNMRTTASMLAVERVAGVHRIRGMYA